MINFTCRVQACKLCLRPPIAHRSEMTAPAMAFGAVECTRCGTLVRVTAANVNEHQSILDAQDGTHVPLIERIEQEAAKRWNLLNVGG